MNKKKKTAGTENLHSLVGLTKALELALENIESNYQAVEELNHHLLSKLKEQEIPFIKIILVQVCLMFLILLFQMRIMIYY